MRIGNICLKVKNNFVLEYIWFVYLELFYLKKNALK